MSENCEKRSSQPSRVQSIIFKLLVLFDHLLFISDHKWQKNVVAICKCLTFYFDIDSSYPTNRRSSSLDCLLISAPSAIILTFYFICLPFIFFFFCSPPLLIFRLTSPSSSDLCLPPLCYHSLVCVRLSSPHLSNLLLSVAICTSSSLSLILHLPPHPWFSSPSDQHGSSKPPLSSSAMTSRILLRQQLMREQLQEQERREQQRQQASQYPQTTAAQTPAINVSVPTSLPPAAQVPMEVLKVSSSRWFLFVVDREEEEEEGMWQLVWLSYYGVCVKFPPLELEVACVTVAVWTVQAVLYL